MCDTAPLSCGGACVGRVGHAPPCLCDRAGCLCGKPRKHTRECDRRTVRLNVRLHRKVAETIKAQAARMGFTVAQFITYIVSVYGDDS